MKNTIKKVISVVLISIIILTAFSAALSALAAEESLHNEQSSVDFSEMNMITYLSSVGSDFYANRDYSDGGNPSLATAYLSSWAGPVSENAHPYNGSLYSKAQYKKLSNIAYLDSVIKINNNVNDVKSAVMEYGALYCGFTYTDKTTDDSNYCTPLLYKTEDGEEWHSHAVTIVGWDDNYPKENFPVQPKKDGAILCKNSWGTDRGYDGYIYISYEDRIFSPLSIKEFAAFTVADKDCGYNKIYQYDEYGANGAFYGLYDKIDYAFNVFPEQGKALNSDETLKAVSFHTTFSNTGYSVYLVEDYQNPEDARLGSRNSKAVKIASGKVSNPGYSVIDLDREYTLKKGTRFAIVLKLDGALGIAEQYTAEVSYVPGVRGNRGESYYSSKNLIIDLYDSLENSNWSIKAFTSYRPDRMMAPGKGLKSYFGIDNENREYSSTKTYSIEEIQKLGGKINQDYIDYLKNPDGSELIPSPLKYSFDTASQKAVSLPAKYDLRDYGYVSTVKDQGFLGSCWAHAALASLESNTLKKYGTGDGIFSSYKTVEARTPCSASISSPGGKETFKFTSPGSAEYTFTLSDGAQGTVYSPFGTVLESGGQSITCYIAKGDSVFLTAGFSSSSATGVITVTADTETLYDERTSTRIEAGSSVKSRTSGDSYSIFSVESESYFSGYYRIVCGGNIDITVNDREIEPNRYYEFSVYTDYRFYEEDEPSTYSMQIVINSTDGKEVDFEIETVSYAEYMCKDSVDIALNETVHVELTEDYETVYAFRFVPEKSGFYCAESDNGIHVNVFDADKERVAANKSNGYSYYLKKDCEYYFGLICYESGNFYIAEYDGSSHSIELKENEPVDDKLYSAAACHEYSFTAKEEGNYRFIIRNINKYDYTIELNDKSANATFINGDAYIYTSFDKGERKTVSVRFAVDESGMYWFGHKYTVSVERSNGTSLMDDAPEIASGDSVTVSDMAPVYKFVAPKDGELAFEVTHTPAEDADVGAVWMYLYNESAGTPYYERSFFRKLDRLTYVVDGKIEFEKGKTYFIYFECGGASSFVFNVKEYADYDITETETLTLDNTVNVTSLNCPINVPVSIAPRGENIGNIDTVYFYIESVYSDSTLRFESDSLPYFGFDFIGQSDTDKGTFISKWKLNISEGTFGSNDKEEGTLFIEDNGEYNLWLGLDYATHRSYFYLPDFVPYKSIYRINPHGSNVVKWTSSDPNVASVDESGTVTARRIGSTVITAVFEDGTVDSETLYVKYAWWQTLIRIFLLGFIWY